MGSERHIGCCSLPCSIPPPDQAMRRLGRHKKASEEDVCVAARSTAGTSLAGLSHLSCSLLEVAVALAVFAEACGSCCRPSFHTAEAEQPRWQRRPHSFDPRQLPNRSLLARLLFKSVQVPQQSENCCCPPCQLCAVGCNCSSCQLLPPATACNQLVCALPNPLCNLPEPPPRYNCAQLQHDR